MARAKVRVKRVDLEEFEGVRPSGLIAIKLDEADYLGWVCLTTGEDDILLVTRQGMALRFSEDQIRPMGRTAMGVTGIRLRNDKLAGMEAVEPGGFLLVVTDNGFGKRTLLTEYRAQTRGGKGVINIKANKRNGPVVAVQVVKNDEEIMMVSAEGIAIRFSAEDISKIGRATQGVTLMKLDQGDTVVAMARGDSEIKGGATET